MKKRKETKKEAILKAAKSLFWRHGLRRISIIEICNSANVSKMTFYKYFANKEVLAEYLITEMLTDWHNDYRTVMSSDLAFTAKINQVIALEQKASQNMSEEFLGDIYNNEFVGLQQLINNYRDIYHAEIVKDMIEAQKSGQVRADIKPEFILYILEDIGNKVMDEKLSKLYPSKQAVILELTNYFFYGILNTANENLS
ncbi:MAG: TetR/AcrR family transcriptional regulator [Bacteroidales bacterium]|jgi:AcrR family transcriptional regulator|nr:TetR/AcrR family transcriptional regulator [Bacteroidales bacterium]